jgi:hypothetical protein
MLQRLVGTFEALSTFIHALHTTARQFGAKINFLVQIGGSFWNVTAKSKMNNFISGFN